MQQIIRALRAGKEVTVGDAMLRYAGKFMGSENFIISIGGSVTPVRYEELISFLNHKGVATDPGSIKF